MSTMPPLSDKLNVLLRLLWQSPIFGDSFPPGSQQAFLTQFKQMYPAFVEKITPILRLGMPELNEAQLQDLVGQLAPKSIAFCAAISAGEIDHPDVLAAAVVMGLLYWVDQSMDRGDKAMLKAVRLLTVPNCSADSQSEIVQTRLRALRQFDSFLRQIPSKQDVPLVVCALEIDVLLLGSQLRTFSQELLFTPDQEAFWQVHGQEIAQNLIDSSGLMTVTSLLYAIKRHLDPNLPPLEQVLNQPELVHWIHKPLNAAVRIFDDAGDWQIDAGRLDGWGIFNINIFNQANPTLNETFLAASGFNTDEPLFAQAQAALTSHNRQLLTLTYIHWVRQQTALLSPAVQERYADFILLVKRVMEGALVNVVGDIFLAERTDDEWLDRELLALVSCES